MIVRKILTSTPFNFLLNNLFWIGCVAGRYEFIWLVLPAIVCYVALLVQYGTITVRQIMLPLILGILVDSVFTATGVFQFEHHQLLLPLWMCSLWLAFVTTLPLSLRLLGQHPAAAALAGAIGFPFAYYVGFELGAISYGLPLTWVFVLMALTWAVLLPVMFNWINRYEVACHETA